MRTILHVIPARIGPAPDGCSSWSRRSGAELLAFTELAAVDTERRHELLFLGGSQDARDAAALGAPVTCRVAPVLGLTALARRSIENVMDDLDPDAVVSWDPSFSPRLRRLRGLPSRVATIDLRKASVEARGVNPETGEARHTRAVLTPAPVRLGPVRSREELRARFKVEPDDRVIGLLSDLPECAMCLAFVLGMLNLAGVPCTGLLRRDAPGVSRVQRHACEGGYLPRIVIVDAPVWRYLPMLDVGIMRLGREPVLGELGMLREALGTGLPIVTASGEKTTGLYPGDAAACLARSEEAPDVARAVKLLLAEPGTLRRVSAGLREAGAARPAPLARQIAAALNDLGGLA